MIKSDIIGHKFPGGSFLINEDLNKLVNKSTGKIDSLNNNNDSIQFDLDATDPNDKNLSVEILFFPNHGSLLLTSLLEVIYSPVNGYVGEDYFNSSYFAFYTCIS